MLSWRGKKTNDVLQHTDDIAPSFAVEYLPKQCGKENILPSNDVTLYHVKESSKHYFTAVECPVTTSRELRTNTDGGSTLHLELDISSHKGIRYETADKLGFLPVNNISVMEAVAKALQFDLDAVFQLKPLPKNKHKFQNLFPTPCTVRWCLLHYCDLTTPPSGSQLGLLENHAKNTSDKNSLQLMASFSKLGQKEYKQKISDPHIGMA
jgi:NADPH-ferrihemoprotein reductase